MNDDFRAFTVAYDGKVRVLISEVTVGLPFDPSRSPVSNQEKFFAIWDTGATGCVISKNVVNKCALAPIGMTKVYTASSGDTGVLCKEYLISLGLPNDSGFSILRVTEGEIKGADLLIGMDVIGRGDFAVTSNGGKTVFSFCSPSMARIDFVEEINKINRKSMGKTSRNAPCPCGSGKKYKKCCGQNA